MFAVRKKKQSKKPNAMSNGDEFHLGSTKRSRLALSNLVISEREHVNIKIGNSRAISNPETQTAVVCNWLEIV